MAPVTREQMLTGIEGALEMSEVIGNPAALVPQDMGLFASCFAGCCEKTSERTWGTVFLWLGTLQCLPIAKVSGSTVSFLQSSDVRCSQSVLLVGTQTPSHNEAGEQQR